MFEKSEFNKAILVSGDGDFKDTIDYFIEKSKFFKILLPNRRHASSLYLKMNPKYYSILESDDIKKKISYR